MIWRLVWRCEYFCTAAYLDRLSLIWWNPEFCLVSIRGVFRSLSNIWVSTVTMWRCDFSKIITASVSVSLQGYESGEPGKNGLSPFYTAMRVGEVHWTQLQWNYKRMEKWFQFATFLDLYQMWPFYNSNKISYHDQSFMFNLKLSTGICLLESFIFKRKI